jgi:hypothetical protein
MPNASWKCAFTVEQGIAGVDGLQGDLHEVECGADASHVVTIKDFSPVQPEGVIESYGACPGHVDRMSVPDMYTEVIKVGALVAWYRDERDPCERSTVGCSVAHGVAGADSECATW